MGQNDKNKYLYGKMTVSHQIIAEMTIKNSESFAENKYGAVCLFSDH